MFGRQRLLTALVAAGLSGFFFSCFDNGGDGSSDEGWDQPTTGVITTVREVAAGDFKIASEEPVPSVEDSRVIVQPMNGPVDTLTLAEAKAISESQDTTSGNQDHRRAVRRSSYGFFGYMMLGRMMGGGPSRGAYVNGAAYSRATSTTGSTLRNTSRRVGGSGRNSGFGSGSKSTRSFGG